MMKSSLHTAVGVLAVFLMAGSVLAQEPIDELEVDLGPTDLSDIVRQAPHLDSFDSVAAFTSKRNAAIVRCWAYTHNGILVGRARTRVPRRGVRLIRASHMSGGFDFVGQIRCSSAGDISTTAFLVGPKDITNLPVEEWNHDGVDQFRIPINASF